MFGRTDSRALTDRAPRRIRRALLHSALVAALTAAAVGCGSSDDGPVLTIGAGDSAQSRVLAEIYAQALARTGVRTATKNNLGERQGQLAALDSNTVAVVSDVSGDLLTALDSTSKAEKPDNVLKALNSALPEGLTVSDAAADGTDLRPTVVAATTRTADFPSSLKALAPRCEELTVGIATGPALDPMRAPLDPQRDVVDPLHTVYGCTITHYQPYPSDMDLRKALSEGEIQLGVLSGPASFLPAGGPDLTSLADPDYAFRAANILALLRKSTLTAQQLRKLNYVSGELDTTSLADMIRAVRDNHALPADLARSWLDDHAL
ncbi:glycine betaine ABC transporter substrate-binding protein [Nocardia sp. NPDC051030]|uniref:glycine betaine ABC transporter substrate-binding protein n=1 Tax=Nocardia sp. NPDC051030 TaxID=3155162 RepID=UPI00342E44D0